MSTSWHDGTTGRHTADSTSDAGSHEQWDELAVGYALTALEPDELDRFFEHLLESCVLCRRSVDETAAIGAQLGSATIRPVEHVSDDLRHRVLEAALEARPAVPQSPAELPTSTDMAVTLRRPEVEPAVPVVDLTERRNRRFAGVQAGRLLAAAAAVIVMVLSVTTVAALRGQSQQRQVSAAQQRAIDAFSGGTGLVVPMRDDNGNKIATVVARDGSISVVAQNLRANSASTTYVLWGIKAAAGSNPTALGVFDVRGTKVQAARVGTDSRGHYTGFKTYAVSREPGHTPPAKPSTIVALGTA